MENKFDTDFLEEELIRILHNAKMYNCAPSRDDAERKERVLLVLDSLDRIRDMIQENIQG